MNLSQEIEAHGQLKGISQFFEDRKMALEVLFHLAGNWYLFYLVYMWGSDYYLWIGGAPAENPAPKIEIEESGWVLPPDLLNFYQVHHGFGESDTFYAPNFDDRLWSESCIKPAHRLELLDKPAAGGNGEVHQPGETLLFLHDGGGDHYGFMKQTGKVVYYNQAENLLARSPAGDFYQTVDEYFSVMFY